MLDKVKTSLRITISDFDEEINDLIEAAYADLGLVGVYASSIPDDPLIINAVKMYCKLNWGDVSDKDYDRLKQAYDETKAAMMTATGYTDWGDDSEPV